MLFVEAKGSHYHDTGLFLISLHRDALKLDLVRLADKFYCFKPYLRPHTNQHILAIKESVLLKYLASVLKRQNINLTNYTPLSPMSIMLRYHKS